MTDQKLKIDFATAGLIDLDGTRWITDRYVAIRCDAAALTTEDLDELPMPAPIDRAKYPYSASDPQTNGPIGPNLAALLWVNSDDRGIALTVHDSDKPGIYAICRDGDMIGFSTAPVPVGDEAWTPTIDPPKRSPLPARSRATSGTSTSSSGKQGTRRGPWPPPTAPSWPATWRTPIMTDHLTEARACIQSATQSPDPEITISWLAATCEQIIAHLEAQQAPQEATSAEQPEPAPLGGSDFMDWMAGRLADPEVRAGYLAAHAREVREQVASELIPVVAHKGPNDTDLSLLDEAAHRVEHGYSLDSNITTAVVRLIRNAIHIARKEQP